MNNPVSLTLSCPGTVFKVQSLVIAAEVAHLPVAYAIVTLVDGGACLDDFSASTSLQLTINGDGGPSFGVTNWFVQSIGSLARPQALPSYSMRLGVVPGQYLPLKGHAADDKLMSTVLADMGARYLGQPVIDQRLPCDDPQLGAVLSYGESFEQFLQRMAWASDQWFCASGERSVLQITWAPQLQLLLGMAATDKEGWTNARVASEQFVGPTATRSFWPRSLVSNLPAAAVAVDLHTTERTTLWPKVAAAYEQTIEADSPWQAAYYLSDSIAHADAWPGMLVTDHETFVATIHVYHQPGTGEMAGAGEVRRLLGALVPGMRRSEHIATLADNAAFGVAAVALSGTSRYGVAAGKVERLRWLACAQEIAQALGIPALDESAGTTPPPAALLATVAPWEEDKPSPRAAGGIDGVERHTTEIKVCFDWSDVPVRIPFAYPMSGSDGTVFCPPSTGDRVLVHLDRLWPLVAGSSFQCGDTALPGVLWHEGNIGSLSAPRGWVVKGGMVFRTAVDGDLVIHAAGNLVLRAEKDIFLDGAHLHDHGRARDGSDDAAPSASNATGAN